MEVSQFSSRVALFIGNTNGGNYLSSLPQVESDLLIARSNLQTMGFYEDEIVELIDKSNEEME